MGLEFRVGAGTVYAAGPRVFQRHFVFLYVMESSMTGLDKVRDRPGRGLQGSGFTYRTYRLQCSCMFFFITFFFGGGGNTPPEGQEVEH